MIFAPDLKASIFANFLVPDMVGGWDFGGRLDYVYSDEYYTDISYVMSVLTDSYSLYNASFKFVSPTEKFTISLIGRNLTEEEYCAWCIPSGPNVLASMNPPREIILRFSAALD